MFELEFVRKGNQYEILVNRTPSHAVPAAQLMEPLDIDDDLVSSIVTYGQRLYELVFRDGTPAQTALAHATNAPERIFLVFGEYQELQAIPWEYLHDGTRFIAMRHHLLRALPSQKRRAWSDANTPLKICALLADPVVSDNQPIAILKAWDDLLAVVQDKRGVYLEWVLPPTLNRLRERLDPSAFNLVHILCHGDVSEDGQGKAVLALQDNFGNEVLTPADRLVDTLQGRASLVVLNACMSATAGRHTLSNLAYALVREGIPYALGMQFVMAESASFVLSRTLYTELAKGGTVEEAVRQARNSILDAHEIPEAAFWAGVPALYTSLDSATSPAIALSDQPPVVNPEPRALLQRQQLHELATSDVLIGRGSKLVEVATALQRERDRRSRFITLHGIGGIGKTSLAAEAARRSAWAFEHRVLGLSLEVLPAPDTFIGRLAQYYLGAENIDPTWDPSTLRDHVIAHVRSTPSILLLDNLETVIDAAHPQDGDQPPDPDAQQLESIILNLAGGATAILSTSRVRAGWDDELVIEVEGLAKEDGARLFLRQLTQRRHAISQQEAESLSERVNGHPLALRLLASEFDRDHRAFADFWQEIDAELIEAENLAALKNLRDPERQKTLIGCIGYSARRLPADLQETLRALFVFKGPFVLQAAAAVLDNPAAETMLKSLVDRSLLTCREEAGFDGQALFRLSVYSLHPVVRWYIDWSLQKPEPDTVQRYGLALAALTAAAVDTYWQRRASRRLIDLCLEDMLAAAGSLDTRVRGLHLHRLGEIFLYRRLFGRALELYEQALDSLRQVDDPREVAVTLHAMGDVYLQQRNFARALELYEQARDSLRQVDDPRSVAVTLSSMGDVYRQQRNFARALELYEQALEIKRPVDDPREVAVTLSSMGEVYRQQRNFARALELYEQALDSLRQVDDPRSVAVTLHAMGEVYRQQRNFARALELYEQALEIKRQVDDPRSVAVTLSSMGDVYLQQRNFARALELYEQALEIKRQVDDPREVAVTLSSMGEVYRQQRNFARALELYEQALEIKRQVDDPREVAVTLSSMGDVYLQQRNFARALELYEQALDSLRQVDDPREVAVTLSSMGDVYLQQRNFARALELYEQALDSLRQVDDPREVAVTLSSMGDVYLQQRNFARALELYEQALDSLRQVDDPRSVAVTLHAMGEVYRQQRNFARALELYEQALEIKRPVDDPREVAVTLSSMGEVYRQQRNFARALELYEQALEIKRQVDDPREVAVTLSSMGEVYSEQLNFARALELYEQALDSLRQVDDPRSVAVTLHAMGEVYSEQLNFARALELYEQALEIKRQVDDPREVAVTLSSMGEVYRQQRNFARALELYEQALEIKRQVDDPREVAVTLSSMGDVYRQQRNFARALELYEQALDSLRQVDDPRSVAVTLHAMGEVYRQQRNFARALELYEQALDSLRQVDDPRSVAVTLHAMGEVYRQQRNFARALELYEQALDSLRQVDDPRSVAVTLHAMGDVYRQQRNFARALELYEQALDSLRQVDDPHSVAVTLGMMAQAYFASDQPDSAVKTLWEAYQMIGRVDDPDTAQAMAEMLRQFRAILGEERFDAIWQQVIAQPQPDWLAQGDEDGLSLVMKVILEFLQTPDWQAARRVLEANQEVLFSEQVEEILEANIQQAREAGQHELAEMLVSHLERIRRARKDGVDAAFPEPSEEETELMDAIQAFVNAQDRDARRLAWEQHHEALCQPAVQQIFELNIQQAQQAGDEALLSRLIAERDLIDRARQEGIEAALAEWEPPAPVNDAATAQPPSLPAQIIALAAHNTLAVLTGARAHLSEWRTQLVQIRNAAVAASDTSGVTYCEALIALLDANGDAKAIKPELSGMQLDAWQQLLAALDSWNNENTGDSEEKQNGSETR